METTHYRACTLCEAICGLEIRLKDGRITSIRGDEADPLSRGHICPKGVALQDLQTDPDRLRRPLRRTPGGWEEIGWEEALDEAAAGLAKIQQVHGRDAVAVYLGNPNVHNYGNVLYLPPLLKTLGSRNRYSATSADQLPHHLAAALMFGHGFLLPVPDLDHTDFFLLLGGNPAVSNGSMMTAPGMKDRLKALRRRGGRFIVLDPRRTETARLADEHHFLRPGSDALLLAALVQVLFAENLLAPGPLAELADGQEEVRRALESFSPEAVAAAVGIEAPTLRHLARDLAAAPSAVVFGRMGVSTQEFGGLCQWLIVLLNYLTGNLDRPGGALFPLPAVSLLRGKAGRRSFGRWRSRVRDLPEYGGELPVSTLAEEMLTPGPGQPRALLTVAGNPVLTTPNGRQLEGALEQLEFMVSVDFYLNETTRHAHLILPPTPPLEHEHYDLIFHSLAVRNGARYSPALFAPPEGALHEWQILHGLRRRLSGDLSPEDKQRLAWEGQAGPEGLLALGLAAGPYAAGTGEGSGLTLDAVKAAPHGIDLGALAPNLAQRLLTEDGRLRLAPPEFLADLPRLAAVLARGEGQEDQLVLVGRRQVRSNNSWMHNVPRLMRGKDRCTLLIHPQDADKRGLEKDQRALVRSRVGQVEVPVEITDEMMPGVVSLPHGWGHGRPGTRLATANASPGASVNDLTDDQRIDTLSGNAAFNGVPVTVTATL